METEKNGGVTVITIECNYKKKLRQKVMLLCVDAEEPYMNFVRTRINLKKSIEIFPNEKFH